MLFLLSFLGNFVGDNAVLMSYPKLSLFFIVFGVYLLISRFQNSKISRFQDPKIPKFRLLDFSMVATELTANS